MGGDDLATHPVGSIPERQTTGAVQRFGEAVDHPAEPSLMWEYHVCRGADFRARTSQEPTRRPERHRKHATVAKTDDLGGPPTTAPIGEPQPVTEGNVVWKSDDLDEQADNATHLTINRLTGNASNRGDEAAEADLTSGMHALTAPFLCP
jgi:hypothetical protein